MPDSRLTATRHRYGVYGLILDSELRLQSIEEMPAVSGVPSVSLVQAPSAFFAVYASRLTAARDDHVHYVVLDDGGIYIHVEKVFEAVVSSDGRVVTCARLGEVEQRSYEANLLNFVLAAALTLQGEEPIHATVVAFDGRAIGMLGHSGAGKSTLAAALVARGGELITDDMLRLTFTDGPPIAQPGPYRLKLFDAAARHFLPRAAQEGHFNVLSGKTMMRPDTPVPAQREGRPLAALFWLSEREPEGGDVSLRQLAGVELAKVLLAATMNSRYQALDRLARQLAFDERLAGLVPVFELTYPRTFAALDRVCDAIVAKSLP
jgi:hypothetical protein